MSWLFGRQKPERDEHVMRIEEQARAGERSLVEKIIELDRKRVDLDRLTADALKDLGRPHRA